MLVLVIICCTGILLQRGSADEEDWVMPGDPELHGNLYRIFVSKKAVTWFEALNECRKAGAELSAIETQREYEWILKRLQKMQFQSENASLEFFVNAHKYLYNSEEPSWKDGSPIEKYRKTVIIDNNHTKACDDERECYLLTTNDKFVAISCSVRYEYTGIICKKPFQNETKVCDTTCSYDHKCDPEWSSLEADSPHCYRIFPEFDDVGNWYESRSVCKQHESELVDIENKDEFKLVKDWIIATYINDRKSNDVTLFVNLHRLAFNESWAWGSGPNTWRVLPKGFDNNSCPPQNCGRFHYAVDEKVIFLYASPCGGSWHAHALCKRRRCPAITVSNQAPCPTNGQERTAASSSPKIENIFATLLHHVRVTESFVGLTQDATSPKELITGVVRLHLIILYSTLALIMLLSLVITVLIYFFFRKSRSRQTECPMMRTKIGTPNRYRQDQSLLIQPNNEIYDSLPMHALSREF